MNVAVHALNVISIALMAGEILSKKNEESKTPVIEKKIRCENVDEHSKCILLGIATVVILFMTLLAQVILKKR